MGWNKFIPEAEVQTRVTGETVLFAEEFGKYLATKGEYDDPLTTSQLRKFFGEVKRQQMMGYNSTNFVMLKPKLAYAVGRAKQNAKKNRHQKIEDFYKVLTDAINKVEASADKVKSFNNFIKIFEAIVAYHKSAEAK